MTGVVAKKKKPKDPTKDIFSAEIDAKVLSEFDQFVDRCGLKKFAAIQAAFRLLLWAPPELRDLLLAGSEDAAKDWFRGAEEEAIVRRATRLLERIAQESESQPGGKSPKAAGGSDR